jgi:hypothetical protein
MEPAASSGMSGIRGTQRPRSLCDSKLLSVTPHGLHHHHSVQQQSSGDQQQQQQLVVKRPPPPLPLSPPRAEPTKYRGSWPSMIYYGGGHDQLQQDADAFVRLEQQKRAPSMAGLMNTTVPQRLVVRPPSLRNSGPRHTPTRNSLRHSRMICLSQQQQGKGLRHKHISFALLFRAF